MDGKLILELKISMTDCVHLDAVHEEVDFIPFTGEAHGEIFNGTILPGGVDIQVVNSVGVRHLCARYMLKGKAADGTDTLIYVDNQAMIQNEGRKLPFLTIPRFITDNRELSKYLSNNIFTGTVEKENGEFYIRIFDIS